MKKYYEYADNVLAGKIVVGESIRLACQRFKADLERADLDFREDKVERAIGFIKTLKHFTGRHSGKPFELMPWQ